MRSVLGWFLLVAFVLVGWFFYNSINFSQAVGEFNEKTVKTCHEMGQKVAARMLAIAKPKLLVGPMDRAIQYGEFRSKLKELYSSDCPNCWKSPVNLMGEIASEHMFAIAQQGSLGGMDSVHADIIARKDQGYRYCLELEEKFGEIFCLKYSGNQIKTWRRLEEQKTKLKTKVEELEKLLAPKVWEGVEEKQVPPSVFVPNYVPDKPKQKSAPRDREA